jgi:hypothetical protein
MPSCCPVSLAVVSSIIRSSALMSSVRVTEGNTSQWFTDEIGHPALAQHLYAVVGFMRASQTWDGFYRMVQRAFPKKGENMLIQFDEDHKK